MTRNEQEILEAKRDVALLDISNNFDYGSEIFVEAMDGWYYDMPGKVYVRSIYVREDEYSDTRKVALNVIFENDKSAKVEDCYVNW